jgi:Rrf2 family protein
MLVLLAANPDEVVSVREIANKQNVPYAFARSIQRSLVQAELTTTTFGSMGGISLARKPEDITLYDVVVAIQGDFGVLKDIGQISQDTSSDEDIFRLHPVWFEANKLMIDFLQSRRLSDLAQ